MLVSALYLWQLLGFCRPFRPKAGYMAVGVYMSVFMVPACDLQPELTSA